MVIEAGRWESMRELESPEDLLDEANEELDARGVPPFERAFENDTYTVAVRDVRYEAGGHLWTHLAVTRIDKAPIHKWADLQQIKNEICDPEREAIELYPAQSRVVDWANIYHLFVLPDDVELAVGFVGDDVAGRG